MIAELLSAVINDIFNQCVFPDTVKTAKVMPVSDLGDKIIITNYRHVSAPFIGYKQLVSCIKFIMV